MPNFESRFNPTQNRFPNSQKELGNESPDQEIKTKGKDIETKKENELIDKEENELIDKLLKIGGARFFLYLPEEVAKRFGGKSMGYNEILNNKINDQWVSESRKTIRAMDIFTDKFGNEFDLRRTFKENGINEGIAIIPALEPIYQETIIKPEKRNWFGKKNPAETKRKLVREESIKFKDAMSRNNFRDEYKDENAYSFIYSTYDDEKSKYDEASWRGSQRLLLEVIIPESLAKELSDRLRKKSKLARKIVEKFMLDDFKIGEDYWNDGCGYPPLRPPYEKWEEKEGGSRVYFRPISGDDLVTKPRNK